MSITTKKDLYTDIHNLRVLCLFSETCRFNDTPIFTMKDEWKGLVSLKRLFMKYVVEDPTEVDFAEAVFGDVQWWMKAREYPAIKPYIEEFRQEADAKRKQIAFKTIIEEAKGGGKSSYTAAKFLIDEPWKDKRVAKEKESSKKSTQKAASVFDDDVARLREEGFLQ